MEKTEFYFFWDGPLSQWHPSVYTLQGLRYSHAEQGMMAGKARHFGDTETLRKIMKAKTPKEQKAFGRQVRGFVSHEWAKIAREIVFDVNMAKFSQNKKLKEFLLNTGDNILVEASPYDRIWGIGLAASDPRAKDRSKWLGTNWLGEVLMKVRKELRDRR